MFTQLITNEDGTETLLIALPFDRKGRPSRVQDNEPCSKSLLHVSDRGSKVVVGDGCAPMTLQVNGYSPNPEHPVNAGSSNSATVGANVAAAIAGIKAGEAQGQ